MVAYISCSEWRVYRFFLTGIQETFPRFTKCWNVFVVLELMIRVCKILGAIFQCKVLRQVIFALQILKNNVLLVQMFFL